MTSRNENRSDRKHTGTIGGVPIEGHIHTEGGDFVGRDKKVYGDEVHGDKVLGVAIPDQWLSAIGQVFALIVAAGTLGITALALAHLFRDDIGASTDVVAISALAMWLVLLWLGRKHTKPQRAGGQGELRYPWISAVSLAILLLAVTGIGYRYYVQHQPPTRMVILVADFEGPELEEYRVTEIILGRLRNAFREYDDVQVDALGRAINEADGRADARLEGARRKAAVVIWGWYGVTQEAVPLSVHFEVLREPEWMPDLPPTMSGETQVMPMAQIKSCQLQTHLSTEMVYLSLFTVGLSRLEANDYEGAIRSFSDALEHKEELMTETDLGAVYFYRGIAYQFLGKADASIADFSTVLVYNPSSDAAYTNRGLSHLLAGDGDSAIADMTSAIELGHEPLDYANRGSVYADKGQFDRAMADYDQAIVLSSDTPEILGWLYAERGKLHEKRGDYPSALADFEQAILVNDEDAEAYALRGAEFQRIGDHSRAVADYDKAIALEPENAQFFYLRGSASHDMGALDKAIADYRKAISLCPSCASAYNSLGVAYFDKREYQRAAAYYDQAIRLDQQNPDYYSNRANARNQLGDYDGAIFDCDAAINIQPDLANPYGVRGRAYQLKGETQKAIADFERLLGLTDDPALTQSANQRLRELGALP